MASLPADPSVQALFDGVKVRFLNSVPERHRSILNSCTSAEALKDSIENLHKDSRRVRSKGQVLQKLSVFGARIQPFFKVIEILCGSHPEYANLVWGTLLLLFQLASNFTSFFEKLGTLLETIAFALPHLHDTFVALTSHGQVPSIQLKDALSIFYDNLFQVLYELIKIFLRSDGTPRNTALAFTGLLWRPFDSRFGSIVEKIKACQSWISEETRLMTLRGVQRTLATHQNFDAHSQNLRSTIAAVEQVNSYFDGVKKELFNASILRWLSAPNYATLYHKALDQRESGTAEWLFDEKVYASWADTSQTSLSNVTRTENVEHMLWIHGKPGAGKTVLAASVLERLLADSTNRSAIPTRIVCYYFFDGVRTVSEGRLSAYSALVSQIFDQAGELDAIGDIFALFHHTTKSGTTERELLDILSYCAATIPHIYILLDGLDECDEHERVVEDLQNLSTHSSVRTIIFSRPHLASLRACESGIASLGIQRLPLESDMALFLESELQYLIDHRRFPIRSDIEWMRNRLVERADGMFLWARLMIAYLKSPALSPTRRIATIEETTPDGIDEIYWKIFSLLSIQVMPNQQLAAEIFAWISQAFIPCTASHFHDIIDDYYRGDEEKDPENGILYMEHAIIVSCCGFVEIRPDRTFSFTHMTARNFLDSNKLVSPSGVDFNPRTSKARSFVTTGCITYLKNRVPQQPLSGDLNCSIRHDDLISKYPALNYVVSFWCQHVFDVLDQTGIAVADAGVHFLDMVLADMESLLGMPCNLMVWIESFFTLQASFLAGQIRILEQISRWLYGHTQIKHEWGTLAEKVSQFTKDLSIIDREWGDTLIHRPCEIWGDVTIFTPSRYLLTTKAASIQTVRSSNNDDTRTSHSLQFSVSSTSADGKYLSTLTVVPSSSFEMLWNVPRCLKPGWAFGPIQLAESTPSKDPWQESLSELSDRVNQGLDCGGWYAHYEVYMIEGSTKLEKMISARLLLNEEEIQLQLRQSLRGTFALKIEFPMSISPDLTIITVLRSVYVFHPCEKGYRYSGPHNLDMSHRQSETSLNWSTQRQAMVRLPYLYSTAITCENKYLVLKDQDMGLIEESSFSVFELNIRKLSANPRLLWSLKLQRSEFEQAHWAMHHTLPQLMFAAHGKVVLCDLDARPIEPQIVLQSGDGKFTSLKEIGFSQCGSYFTVKMGSEKWPQIFPLPNNRSSKRKHEDSTASEEDAIHRKVKKPLLASSESKDEAMSVQDVVHQLPSVFTGTDVALAHLHHSSYGEQRYPRLGEQRIDLVLPSKKQFTPLVTLPQSINIRDTKATVIVPTSDQHSNIQLVLNRQKPWSYSSDEKRADHLLPLLLDRQVSSLVFREEKPQARVEHAQDID